MGRREIMRVAPTFSTRVLLAFLGAALNSLPALAQDPSRPAVPPLDPAAHAQEIEAVLKELNRTYVFPEVARKMEDAIRQRMRSGEYDSEREGERLARKLTNDLRVFSRDKHLEVSYSPTET